MNWISGFTILILVTGLIVGLCVAGADLLNPTTSQAETERIQAETRHLDAMNRFEEELAAAKTAQEVARIRQEMGIEEARYQAELARIAADQAQYERMLNIKANAYQGFMIVSLIISGAGGISLVVIGTKFFLARIPAEGAALSSAAATQPPRQIVRRHSPNGYEQMRINARQRELLERTILLKRMNTICNQRDINPSDYNKLPLAGD